jgi:hypothetical protein
MQSRTAALAALVVVAGLLTPTTPAVAQDGSGVPVTWKAIKDFPTGATRFDGELVGSRVYFLGFRAADGTSTDGSIWYYDLKKNKYVDTGIDMAVPISNYKVAALTDDNGLGLYTFGGRDANGDTSTVVQVFYPKSGATDVLESDPWPGQTPSGCVSLPATGVATADNTAYVMGGMSFSTSIPPCVDDVSSEVWAFNPKAAPGNRWTSQPKLKVARGYVTATVVGNQIYAIGGDLNDAGTLSAITTVEAAKVGKGKWNDAKYKDLPIACDETQAFGYTSGALAKTITIAGCGQWPNAVPDTLQYRIKADVWSTVGALNEARRNHAGVQVGGKSKHGLMAGGPQMYVFGGYSADGSTVLSSAEKGVVHCCLPAPAAPRAPGPIALSATVF